jgi:N-acetylneuraminic acid mutarotase
VYVLGGFDGQSPVDSVLRTTDGSSLKAVATLPTGVRYTAVAAVDGRIYAFGGELGTGTDTSEIQEYDPASGRTRVAGRLPQPVSHAAAVVLDGSIYLLGGRRNGAASDQILRFDPARGVAVQAGHLASPVFDGAAGSLSGVGYLVGGIGAQGTSVDSILKLSENP